MIKINKENEAVSNLSEQFRKAVDQISSKQSLHFQEFEKVEKVIKGIESKIGSVNATVNKLESESISNIASSVKELENLVTKDLIKDIQDSKSKKNEMISAKNDMEIAFEDLHDTFVSN